MPTIRVTQAPRLVVVFGEEERGVGAVRWVFVEELGDRAQEAWRRTQGNGALAAQIRLQIGHQESPRDSFSRNVADHHPEPVPPQTEEIVVIATHLASL